MKKIPGKGKRWLNAARIVLIASLVSTSIVFAVRLLDARASVSAFFNHEGVRVEKQTIPVRDGNQISAYVMSPANLSAFAPGSVPCIVTNLGINSHKEKRLDKPFNFAKRNAVAIALEARAHGESTGSTGLVTQESWDLIDVITWALATYPVVNASNVGLYGESLGSAFVLMAQARYQPRATVVLHPPMNFTELLGLYHPDVLVGWTWTLRADAAGEWLEARSPASVVNYTNTQHVLYMQGTEDTTVTPDDALVFARLVENDTRDDIQVLFREGLGHGGNERSERSFQYTLAWFEAYLWGRPLNLSTWHEDVAAIQVYPYKPSTFARFENLLAAIPWLTALTLVAIVPWARIWPTLGRQSPVEKPVINTGRANGQLFDPGRLIKGRKMFWTSVGVYGGIAGGLAIAGAFTPISLLWGAILPPLLVVPCAVTGILLHQHARKRTEGDIIPLHGPRHVGVLSNLRGAGILAAIATAALFVHMITYNLVVWTTLEEGVINAWAPGFWLYWDAFFCLLISDVLLFVDFGGLRLSMASPRQYFGDLARVAGLSAACRALTMGVAVLSWRNIPAWNGVPWAVLAVGLLAGAAFVLCLLFGLLALLPRNYALVPLVVTLVLSLYLMERMLRLF